MNEKLTLPLNSSRDAFPKIESRRNFSRRARVWMDGKLNALDSDNRALIARSAAAFIAKIISAIFALWLTALITRALGAREAGYYFWALALITVLATFARTGFDQLLLRFMTAALADGRADRARAIYRYAARSTWIIAATTAALLACVSPLLARWVFGTNAVAAVIAVMAAASIFLALNTLQSQSLLASKNILLSIFVLEIAVPLTMIVLILLLSPHSGIEISAIYLAVSIAWVVVFGIRQRHLCSQAQLQSQSQSQLQTRQHSQAHPQWQGPSQSALLSAEERARLNGARKHLFGVASLSLVTQWGGVILLGWYADAAQIALFSIALRIAMLNSFILRAVNAVVGARFAELFHRHDIEGLRRLALQSSRVMAAAAAPTLLFLLLCARPLLAAFGSEFVAAAMCLAILSLGQFINAITGAVCLLLEMTGGEMRLRRFELISALVMIAGGFALVPRFGATGAAIATACAVASVNFLAVYEVKRRFGFNMLRIW